MKEAPNDVTSLQVRSFRSARNSWDLLTVLAEWFASDAVPGGSYYGMQLV
jgi:hypothetical protein